jgi:hypothetical protein
MRDAIGLMVGLFVGATIVSLVYMSNDINKHRKEASMMNMVPVEQCIDAILSISPKGERL